MSSSTAYALSSLLYTLAGLGAGYWLGRAGRLEATMSAITPAPPDAPRKRRVGAVILGVVLVLLALGTVVVGVSRISEQRALVERIDAVQACQNAYNDANRRRAAQIGEASAKERAAIKAILDASFATPPDPVAAVQQYRVYAEQIGRAHV